MENLLPTPLGARKSNQKKMQKIIFKLKQRNQERQFYRDQ